MILGSAFYSKQAKTRHQDTIKIPFHCYLIKLTAPVRLGLDPS